MLRAALVSTALLASLAPALAFADARQELHAAFAKTLALKSFRASMTDMVSNKPVSSIEYQAPDRFRVTVAGQPPTTMIGDTMYLQAGGQSMKLPLPKGTLAGLRHEKTMKDLETGAVVQNLGPGVVGSQPARKYRYLTTVDKQQSTSTIWVGVASGQILQVETSSKHAGKAVAVRMVYSDMNSPTIRIVAPR